MHAVRNDYVHHRNFCCSKTQVKRCKYRGHCYETKVNVMSEISSYLCNRLVECPDEKDTRATLKEDYI